MADKLKGKRILLFCQYFFGYEHKIAAKYVQLGASVDLYDEMAVKSSAERALLKVCPGIFRQKTEKYYSDILQKIRKKIYDFILFIDCEMPTVRVLQACRKVFPEAKLCLHLWDSVKNLKGVERKFPYFDYITSFDRNDAKRFGHVNFRPLFYCDEFRAGPQKGTAAEAYDLCFIGTVHSDRYKVLKTLLDEAGRHGLRTCCYLYLQSRFIYYFYRVLKKEFRDTSIQDFQFEKKTSAEIAAVVERSKAVIDIQHPGQTGLTMRTLEMLGMKKKIITTNQDIVHYDFYRKNNVMVVDRNHVTYRKDFFSGAYEETSRQVYEYYAIERWCMDVLGTDSK